MTGTAVGWSRLIELRTRLAAAVGWARVPRAMLADLDTAELQSFRAEQASRILGWARTDAELDAWASLQRPVLASELFALWHGEPGVQAFVLSVGGEACGYGEIWHEGDEAELARDRGRRSTVVRSRANLDSSAHCASEVGGMPRGLHSGGADQCSGLDVLPRGRLRAGCARRGAGLQRGAAASVRLVARGSMRVEAGVTTSRRGSP